jgi:hypothetical protein
MVDFDIRGRMKEQGMKRAARKFLRSEYGSAVITVVTKAERQLVEAVAEQHDLLSIDGVTSVPDEEDRAEQLRELALAKIEGRFPAFWVKHCSGLDGAERAARVADADDFDAVIERWASQYETEGTAEEIADGHVRALHGVDLDTFREVVVEWPEDREKEALKDVVVAGVTVAYDGIHASNQRLREIDLDAVQSTPDNGDERP